MRLPLKLRIRVPNDLPQMPVAIEADGSFQVVDTDRENSDPWFHAYAPYPTRAIQRIPATCEAGCAPASG
jgi:hypothetical protein